MPKYKIESRRKFAEDYQNIIYLHLELSGGESASNIRDMIDRKVALLEDSPFMGFAAKNERLQEKGYRTLVCGKYLCYYKVTGDTVILYRLVDGRRNYIPELLTDE